MKRSPFFCAFFALFALLTTPKLSADFAFDLNPKINLGRYVLTGTNLDGNTTYEGTVHISKRGKNYRFEWDIAGRWSQQRQEGTGVMLPGQKVISVVFTDGFKSGVAAFYVSDCGRLLEGVWTYDGKLEQGAEVLQYLP